MESHRTLPLGWMAGYAALLSLAAAGRRAAISREFALIKAESSRSENPNSLCHAVLQPVFAQNGRARLANQSLHATGISPIAVS